jgi:hypothetical protein
MCFDVEPRMARFYWMLFFFFATTGLFFGAHAAARAWGFSGRFDVMLHLCPLFIIAMAHIPLLGMRYEDIAARNPDETFDPLMLRLAAVWIFVIVGVCFSVSITVDRWWLDVDALPRGPEHASPTATTPPASATTLHKFFSSSTRTPSHTPTPSPDPVVRAKQQQQASDRRSTIGALYVGSVGGAVGTVIMNYMLRTLAAF